MFEHRKEPLLPPLAFFWRVLRNFWYTVIVVALSLLGGTLGFLLFVDAHWGDAFHHACLVLGEHTLDVPLKTTGGKVFVGLYVMYSRLVFFAIVTVLVLPLAHCLLHKLHLDCSDTADGKSDET